MDLSSVKFHNIKQDSLVKVTVFQGYILKVYVFILKMIGWIIFEVASYI